MTDLCRIETRGRASLVLVVVAAVVIATITWLTLRGSSASSTAPVPDASMREATVEVSGSELETTSSEEPQRVSASTSTPAGAAAIDAGDQVSEDVVLRVSTHAKLAPSRDPVPNVAFAIGLGAPFDPVLDALVEGRTGDDGSTTITTKSREIAEALARGERIWARVVEPGFQQRTRTFGRKGEAAKLRAEAARAAAEPSASATKSASGSANSSTTANTSATASSNSNSTKAPAASESATATATASATANRIDVELLAHRGPTLRGRVLDSNGNPIAARIRVVPWLFERGLGMGGLAESSSDGWFEALPYEAGTFQVIADAGDRGTDALTDVIASVGVVPPPLELVVSGPGVVRGRVRDETGRPAAGIDVEVVEATYDRARQEPVVGNAVRGARRLGELELEGRGRVHAQRQTNAKGEFETRGLLAGVFVVRVVSPSVEPAALLTPVPVPSDGEPLDLVRTRPYLAVRVVDADGLPWAKVEHAFRRDVDGGWPPDPRVAVTPSRPEFVPRDGLEGWTKGRRVAVGEFVFEVRTSTTYRVGLIGGSQRWAPLEIEVPANAGRIDVTLQATKEASRGSLLVDVVTPDGKRTSRLSIRIEDPRTGDVVVDRAELFDAGWPQGFSLPEGDYRVVVDGAPSIGYFHGTLDDPRQFGRFEAGARVVAGSTVRVAGTLPRGARVRVKLVGAANDADRAAIAAQFVGVSVGIENWNEVLAARAGLLLCTEGRRPIEVEFTEVWGSTSAAGTHLSNHLALGATDVSQLVPAGRFTLEARLPGGRVVSKPVVLVDGETTEVELAFE